RRKATIISPNRPGSPTFAKLRRTPNASRSDNLLDPPAELWLHQGGISTTRLRNTCMEEEITFPELIRRVQAGDEAAATELEHEYGRVLRSHIRRCLAHKTQLRSVCDVSDICQSVLKSFFARMTRHPYQLDTPEQLRNLLKKMAEHV